MASLSFISSRRTVRAVSALAFGPTLFLMSPLARAQDMSEAGAQLLDAEGTALLNQRKLATACPKLELSYRLKPGTGVLLRLALCQELSGKRASALGYYLEAVERGHATNDPQIVKLAQSRAEALRSQLSFLTIECAPSFKALTNLRISLDGAPLEPKSLGADLPVDPGSHQVEAEAPGRRRFEQTIAVGDQPEHYAIAIELPVNATLSEPEAAALPPRATATRDSSWSTQHSMALVAGGVGIAGVAAGTFLGLAVGSQMDRARAMCSDGTSGCSPEALALQDKARGYSLASTLSFCAGAAGILGGVALWLTAPRGPERPLDAQLRLVPMVGTTSSGIQAVGTW